MPIEGRLTICNLSIELGAKMGMVPPDGTPDYLRGRAYERGASFRAMRTPCSTVPEMDGFAQ